VQEYEITIKVTAVSSTMKIARHICSPDATKRCRIPKDEDETRSAPSPIQAITGTIRQSYGIL